MQSRNLHHTETFSRANGIAFPQRLVPLERAAFFLRKLFLWRTRCAIEEAADSLHADITKKEKNSLQVPVSGRLERCLRECGDHVEATIIFVFNSLLLEVTCFSIPQKTAIKYIFIKITRLRALQWISPLYVLRERTFPYFIVLTESQFRTLVLQRHHFKDKI